MDSFHLTTVPYGNFRNYYNLRKSRKVPSDHPQNLESASFVANSSTSHSRNVSNLDPRVLALSEWIENIKLLSRKDGESKEANTAKDGTRLEDTTISVLQECNVGGLKTSFERVLDLGTNSGKVAIELGEFW